MMSAPSLPIAFKPRCDHSCHNMHSTAHLGPHPDQDLREHRGALHTIADRLFRDGRIAKRKWKRSLLGNR